RDLSNEAYHGGEGISKSQLDLIAKAPALFQWNKAAPEDLDKSKALDFGDAAHAFLLEPKRFAEQYAIGPANAPRNTKAGKEAWEAFEATLSEGQVVLTADQGKQLQLIRESVMAHPHARWLIETVGDVEASIYWKDLREGVLCRCRPDKAIPALGWLMDLKTTADMSRFIRYFHEYRYHVQDAFYSDGYAAEFGEQPAGFVFLVVSTSIDCGKYPVRLFTMDSEAKEAGRQTYIKDLATYADCLRSNEWPAIETLSLPYWAKERI
ncbi:PD-(D/E)XK nuclease-like domain-containing protein, partial [Azorhizophilus paspali]